MPALLGLLGFALPSLTKLVGSAGTIAELLVVIAALMRIYFWISAAWVAFWAVCAIFAKEIMAWFLSVFFWLVDNALQAAHMPQGMASFQDLINALPPFILEMLARSHVWDNLHFLVSCYFVHLSLRSLPIVGRIFQ